MKGESKLISLITFDIVTKVVENLRKCIVINLSNFLRNESVILTALVVSEIFSIGPFWAYPT